MKWHGGKGILASRIIAQFPKHHLYLEPFGGGGSVLLKKQPSPVEVYNDLDERITRLFRVLRKHSKEFIRQVELIPYSQAEFRDARPYPKHATVVEKAVCDFIRFRQSFAGRGQSWSYSRTVSHGGTAGQVNAWLTAIDSLPDIVARLRRVQILCQPALEAIKRFDSKDTLIYCDPPYVHATRTVKQAYAYEMSDDDHRELAHTLQRCKSKVILSGYPSDLYEKLYRKWRCVTFDVAAQSARVSKPRRQECLWMNY